MLHKQQSSNLKPAKAVWQAIANMREKDLRFQMSARYIQRKWHDQCANLQRRESNDLQWCVESKTVKAPTYFGESSLWLPFNEWDVVSARYAYGVAFNEWDVVSAHYAYGVRCVQCCELLLIPREKLKQLIHDYSPWLRQRFESFRADVITAQAKITQQQHEADTAGATLPHVPKASREVIETGRCVDNCAVDIGTVTLRVGPSNLA
eukprot:CAMPEP_0172942978 /NCGR_PEP_ID=MMETSP1075-20121228/225319_1 /TAXON_ID=2916 /ORGANISM="Ceratium fusus, Strain PA161109" /LENGTH=206 /DNA_ID=CAMNT_0013804403 /DNA_START=81 /DNA_END=699 /DNA_ORIENTATION=+